MQKIKNRKLLTVIFTALSLAAMCFVWYTGVQGGANVRGVIVLVNPLTLAGVIMSLAGVGLNQKEIAVTGNLILLANEVIYFLFWYVMLGNKAPFSLANSFAFAAPFSYIGLALAAAALICTLTLPKIKKLPIQG